jgi:hypothetical protein
VVFSIRVTRPESVAGRAWNLVQDLCGVAAVVLIVLKLTGLITWSWWWVLSPLYPSGFLLAAVLCGLLVLLVSQLRWRRRLRRLWPPDLSDSPYPPPPPRDPPRDR